jgi:hypothetical protein
MKINELKKLGIHTDFDRPKTGFYDASGNYQKYPKQCPRMVDDTLVVKCEDGQMHELELVKHRPKKCVCEVVFQADGWFWKWDQNDSYEGWTATEDEPDDDKCQFLGEWINTCLSVP